MFTERMESANSAFLLFLWGYKPKLDAVMITNPYFNASAYTVVLRYSNENLENFISLRY